MDYSVLNYTVSQLREKEAAVAELSQSLSHYQKEEGYFQQVEIQGGTLVYKVDTLLLLEVMEELTRVLQAGKSRTVINHLKSL